jgi:hypothetical protein
MGRSDELVREFREAEGRTGPIFTLVAALYPGEDA